MPTNPGKLTWDEIINKFPSVIVIVNTIKDKINDAEIDGKVSGEELGGILAAVAVPLGKLVDEVIVDAND